LEGRHPKALLIERMEIARARASYLLPRCSVDPSILEDFMILTRHSEREKSRDHLDWKVKTDGKWWHSCSHNMRELFWT
jgi:hypothetical protein